MTPKQTIVKLQKQVANLKKVAAKAADRSAKREARLHHVIKAQQESYHAMELAHVLRKKELEEIRAHMTFSKPHVLKLVELTLAQKDVQQQLLERLPTATETITIHHDFHPLINAAPGKKVARKRG